MRALELEEVRERKAQEKQMKELQKEREKLERLQKKEQERLEREQKKEQERQLREIKKEEEKKERERKREQDRLQKEQKKEQERLDREHKKEQDRLEKEQKKEEDKRKRQLEREEKEKDRLEKKRKVQEEKERKEEERKAQEDRSQMKISNFFLIGATKASQPPEPAKVASMSVYHGTFLPFFIKANVVLAPNGQLEASQLDAAKRAFDSITFGAQESLPHAFPPDPPYKKAEKFTSPLEIVNALNSSDVTESHVYSMLSHLSPLKYLHFYENARPPYIGTWCSDEHQAVCLAHPLSTSGTGMDYDYDSDLEWNGEDEGEGEDIDNEDDDEEDDEEMEEDEMEDFVDTNDSRKKRSRFMGPLVSVNKWNDGTNDVIFLDMKCRLFMKADTLAINPLTNYWEKDSTPKRSPEKAKQQNGVPALGGITDPKQVNTLTPHKPTITDKAVLKELILFVEQNCDFTIGTLVELCQKQFKSHTKSIIKHTVQQVAVYDKKSGKWAIKAEFKDTLMAPAIGI